MSSISPACLEELREIYRKKGKRELTDAGAQDLGQGLADFAELLLDASVKEIRRKKRLKKEPKGFHLDESEGIYSCRICGDSISGKQTWWNLNGVKCMNCQRAIDRRIIPKFVCKNRDSWLASWQLKSEYGINQSSIKKHIRLGKLRSKDILDESGNVHFQIFLLSENLNYLATLLKRHE